MRKGRTVIKKTKRKAFNFYRNYYDVYCNLQTDAEKVAFMDALLDKQFLGIDPDDLPGTIKAPWFAIQHQVEQQINGYVNRTGRSLTEGVTDPCQGAPQGACQGTPEGAAQGAPQGPSVERGKRKEEREKSKGEYTPTSADVERVWNAYPNKKGKAASLPLIRKALKTISADDLISRIEAYDASTPDKKFLKHGSTYFRGKHWEDDLTPPKPAQKPFIPAC